MGLFSGSTAAAQAEPPHPDGILAREDPVVEPVGLADWPVLDKALKRMAPATGRIVSFRELWSARPGLGDEPVVISGVVYRRFRSEPRGQFPSLEELWIRTDDDGLAVVTNVVPPKSAGPDLTAPGTPVRLVAFFLRKIRYEAEDEPRIAPWLVARRAESESAVSESAGSSTSAPDSSGDKTVLFVLLATIGAVTGLRLMLFWAERSRRRSDALREARRERARAIGEQSIGETGLMGPEPANPDGGAA